MGIGVHTDMATPALAQYGSDELKRNFLAPAIAGDGLFCLGGHAGIERLPANAAFFQGGTKRPKDCFKIEICCTG